MGGLTLGLESDFESSLRDGPFLKFLIQGVRAAFPKGLCVRLKSSWGYESGTPLSIDFFDRSIQYKSYRKEDIETSSNASNHSSQGAMLVSIRCLNSHEAHYDLVSIK